MSIDRHKKIVIVYDWIDKWGGVERILLMLHEMFPLACFYTSYTDLKKAKWAKGIKFKTSFIQKLPDFVKRNRILSFPFYTYAFETFDFKGYDLVISVSSSFAKSAITRPETAHMSYLLTPTRFLWVNCKDYISNFNKFIFSWYIKYLKKWDMITAQRPDYIFSISENVKQRCSKYYKRNSNVIYPPFDISYWGKIKLNLYDINYIKDKFNIDLNKKYYLIVSRLESYKKVDLAIKVFNKNIKSNLIIIGKGSKSHEYKRLAGKNIKFIDSVTDKELGVFYSSAHALIMPQIEDFGYVALEAQYFNCPVISYIKGGAKETIVDNKTGIFFKKQDLNCLLDAIERFDRISYNIRTNMKNSVDKNLARFKRDRFEKEFKQAVESCLIKKNRQYN